MKAVLCPVCKGEGKVPLPPGTAPEKTCHGCDGKGWVEVPEGIYPTVKVYPIQDYEPIIIHWQPWGWYW